MKCFTCGKYRPCPCDIPASAPASEGERCARLEDALRKVIVHTGHLPWASRGLLEGLLASCARVAREALAAPSPSSAGTPEGAKCEHERVLRTRPDYDLRCDDCGAPHNLDTSIPSEVWNKIARGDRFPGAGVLCTLCIDDRCAALGLKDVVARFYFVGKSVLSDLYGFDAAQPEPPSAGREDPVAWVAYREYDFGITVKVVAENKEDALRALSPDSRCDPTRSRVVPLYTRPSPPAPEAGEAAKALLEVLADAPTPLDGASIDTISKWFQNYRAWYEASRHLAR